jgi:hypothetical protein
LNKTKGCLIANFATVPYKALMGLADGTEHIIQFYEEVPVMLIYLLSAGLTLFFYFIPLKLFFNKKLKLQLQQKQRKDI